MKLNSFQIVLIAAIVLVVAVNVWLFASFLMPPSSPAIVNSDPVDLSDENALPAVSVALLFPADCTDCFDIEGLLGALQAQQIAVENTTRLYPTDASAQQLIAAHSITRLPAAVVSANASAFEALQPLWDVLGPIDPQTNTLVFSNVPPVYFDLEQNRPVGRVNVVVLSDETCPQCRSLISQEWLAYVGIAVSDYRQVDVSSPQGMELIETYGLTRIPAAVFSGDIAVYTDVLESLSGIGELASDGSLVVSRHPPVYRDLATGEIRGLTTLQLVSMPSCAECFDINALSGVFEQQFGVVVDQSVVAPYPDAVAMQLIADYNLSFVPTMVLSGDINAFEGLSEMWINFGSVGPDGSLVFSQVELLGPGISYFDLDQNRVVTTQEE